MPRFAAALLALALITGPAAAQDAKSAEAFLRHIYAAYKAKGPGSELFGPKAGAIFDPGLVALLRADRKAMKGDVELLDGDPICDCQDFDISSVNVAVQPDGDGKAKATATFDNLDAKGIKIDFDLAAVGGQWRIANIHSASTPDFKKALQDEIASAKHRH